MLTKLKGSGGYVIAELNDNERKKADLGVGELFLAPVGRIGEDKIKIYYCKTCAEEFSYPPKIEFENPNEKVAKGMILKERGKYICNRCKSMIGEYRTFSKN